MLRSWSNNASTFINKSSRALVSVMIVSIILWCLSTMASNSVFHSSSPATANFDVAMSLSVMPPRALTTITTGCFFASFSTICFRLRMLFTEPTDVPPNFNTFMLFLVFAW